MGVQSQSALIACLLLSALAINVTFSERRVEHRWAFTGLLVALVLYNLSWFFHDVLGHEAPDDSRFWLRLLVMSGAVTAEACLWFFGRVLRRSLGPLTGLVHLGALVVVVLSLTDLVTEPGVHVASALLALGTVGGCLWRLYQRYREADSPVDATRLGYLVLGGLLSLVLSAADMLPALDVPFPALGHVWTAAYMYFWMQVIQRSRLLDLRELLGRGLALLVLSATISTIYFVLLVWQQDVGQFLFNIFAASLVIFFIFEPLKRVVDVWIGRLLFHETYVLQSEIRALRRELANTIDEADIALRVLGRLRASRRVTHASLFLLDGAGRSYRPPSAQASLGALSEVPLDVVGDRAFLDAVAREKVLAVEQVERELLDLVDADDSEERARLAAVRKTMSRISAGVAFALVSDDRLLGVLNVRDDRTREAFSTYELELLADLGAQIVVALENSELVAALKERDRLSAVGEMATGMAHEIRNPLGAIKSAAQLLEPAGADEEQQELLEVIVEEADRLDHVLGQFLHFARPYRGELAPMHVERIIERVATLMRAEEHAGPIDVQIELEPDLPAVLGDADQLHQVVLNLARNACQAMEAEGGTLLLGARMVKQKTPGRPGSARPRVEVRVSDTGPGIDPGVRPNLFIPFFTTKKMGTGLGLSISQRLLQHHGSSILVDSELGRGTVMRFLLLLEQEKDQLTGEQRRLLRVGV